MVTVSHSDSWLWWRCHTVTVSHGECHMVTMSHSDSVTQSQCHTVTMSHRQWHCHCLCDIVTWWQCHTVTVSHRVSVAQCICWQNDWLTVIYLSSVVLFVNRHWWFRSWVTAHSCTVQKIIAVSISLSVCLSVCLSVWINWSSLIVA